MIPPKRFDIFPPDWGMLRRSKCVQIFIEKNIITTLPCVMAYYIVSGLFLMFFWCPCMAINVNVQYNGGLLPDIDIILLTQCYLHRGTCLNAMKSFFCICSL